MNPFLRRGNRKASSPRTFGHANVNKLGLLRASDLFKGLNESEMQYVERVTVLSRCAQGQLVYRPGDAPETLFLLKQGRLSIYRITPDGKRLVTAVIEPGTMFGDMAFTGTTMAENFAEAQEDSIICSMTRHDMEQLIRRFPSVGIQLLDRLTSRMRDLEARLEEGLLRDMWSRVAAALLRLRDQHSSDEIQITHQELADSLGTYRETVSHTLGELQREGYVRLARGLISIRDGQRLARLVWTDGAGPRS